MVCFYRHNPLLQTFGGEVSKLPLYQRYYFSLYYTGPYYEIAPKIFEKLPLIKRQFWGNAKRPLFQWFSEFSPWTGTLKYICTPFPEKSQEQPPERGGGAFSLRQEHHTNGYSPKTFSCWNDCKTLPEIKIWIFPWMFYFLARMHYNEPAIVPNLKHFH